MKICVMGLWHLGCVTAACLAELGFDVTGFDDDEQVIGNLRDGKAPIYEPGLDDLILKHFKNGKFRFSTDLKQAVSNADFVWIAYDTPVDDDDVADVDFVKNNVTKIFKLIASNTGVIISSQIPVGTTRLLADLCSKECGNIAFAYSPENLRLGKAIEVFLKPDRIIIGTARKDVFQELFCKICSNLEWMGIESAEMVKHGINAFLAVSAIFANELAGICELVGADAKDVSRGMKTEKRIGEYAYVAPGGAISGGTLNRDIVFLEKLSDSLNIPAELIHGAKESNDRHKKWHITKLESILGSLNNKKIGILGLTYKAGTSTLRRSFAVELCKNLSDKGAKVVAFDPEVKVVPQELSCLWEFVNSIDKVFLDADAIVLCTEKPHFQECLSAQNISLMRRKNIVDANGFFSAILKSCKMPVHHVVLGKGDIP